ncbi:MAG: LAGLIDADG family homing endonuclease [Candidatus Aenigmarchaeota archaeon]|nr:LAGLIDADG family homing endonuclease [Candidatus Aenigmarchaeota archaeon]
MTDNVISEQLAYLLGVVGGDGTIYVKKSKQYLVSISDKNKDFHFEVLRPIFVNEFGFNPSIIYDKTRNSWYTIVRNRKIVERIMKFGYSSGRSKTYVDKIPEKIMESNKRIKLWHLAGWIDAEGTSKTKRFRIKGKIYAYPCVELESVNKNYTDGLHELSKVIGFPSTKPALAKRNYINRKPRYTICWNGVGKCQKISTIMKHPAKKANLLSNISPGRRLS